MGKDFFLVVHSFLYEFVSTNGYTMIVLCITIITNLLSIYLSPHRELDSRLQVVQLSTLSEVINVEILKVKIVI